MGLKAKCERGEECTNQLKTELMPETWPLFDLLTTADSQLRAGMGGAYAMDWNVVLRMADNLGIRTDARFYELLKIYESVFIEELNAK